MPFLETKPAQQEALNTLQSFIATQLPLLKSVEDSWQPSDVLPDATREGWHERVDELRRQMKDLTDEVFVVLVGNTITEEALPSYQTSLNHYEVMKDKTGISDTPWAQWTRAWTAEENRHGDILNRFLYLSGRVNMRSVELTTQHLIRNGFDSQANDDMYQAFVYTSFQERATRICHSNLGRIAERLGDSTLARICFLMAGDEARHEEGYKRIFAKIMALDPEEGMQSFALHMQKKVVMPARLMSDGSGRDLYNQFALVAQRIGMYTVQDYADVVDHLVNYWKIQDIRVSSPEAVLAKEYLCSLSDVYRKKSVKMERLITQIPKKPFSWIFNRAA